MMTFFGKRMVKRLFAVIIMAVLIASMLTACSGKQQEVSYIYHEEPVYISVGESAELVLENVPEGKTAADFTWEITGDTAEVSEGIVTGVQTHPSKLSGEETVRAELVTPEIKYVEVFDVVVEKSVESITLKYNSITLLIGDEIPLSYNTEPKELSNGQRVIFELSDDIAEITEDNVNHNKQIKAVRAGSAVLTVSTGGKTITCDVNVFDEPVSADEKLRYLCSWQDSYAGVGEFKNIESYGRYNHSGVDVMLSEIPVLKGTEGSGKYMVIWQCPKSSTYSEGFEEPNRDIEGECNYTAALPPEVRPETWDEVEYIIRVKEGDCIQVGTYEGGVKAMKRVVEITKETTDGEVLEVIDSRQGGQLPDSIMVDEKADPKPEAYYGKLPDMEKVKATLSEILKGLH